MFCGCDLYDPPEFYREDDRVARATHQCTECNHPIRRGEEYRYICGKWDAHISTHKLCSNCSDISDSLAALGLCHELGGLEETYQEYLEEVGCPRRAIEIMRPQTRAAPETSSLSSQPLTTETQQ